ncbi:MAG: hydroxymethylbilane synthase [Acidobacteria bacterium]|nr:hydroxymethylbilane synthase [Acidobacteriota bacterium]
MPRVLIGSRGSTLALTQAGVVRDALRQRFPSLRTGVVPIRTGGDRDWKRGIARFPGKGVFVKEIEEALLAGKIDLAVHSLKDLPTGLAPGLRLGAVPQRGDPRDCLVALRPTSLEDLPPEARVGTGSPRRACQLLARRPDLRILPVRGNIGTRLRKLREGEFEALLLAVAGLTRLGIRDYAIVPLDPDICLPAPGQGAIGVEVRDPDPGVEPYLGSLDHAASHRTVRAERAFLEALGGGCRVPIGGLATLAGKGALLLRGMIATPDGREMLRLRMEARGTPESLGERLARRFLDRGGARILAREAAGG